MWAIRRLQDLQGDLAVKLEVLGKIDRRHAAFTEVALDLVAVGEGGGELGGYLGHGRSARVPWIGRRASGSGLRPLTLQSAHFRRPSSVARRTPIIRSLPILPPTRHSRIG